jgi:hypothetical protein
MAERALGDDDDEGPALGVVAELLGKADLGLPEAFAAAFSSAVQEQDYRREGLGFLAQGFRLFEVGFVEVFGEIDLEFIGDAVDFDGAVEEAGFLEGFWGYGGVRLVLGRVRGWQGLGAEGAGGQE